MIKLTFKDAYNQWYDERKMHLLDTTRHKKELYARAYILPHLGELKVDEIKVEQIESYRDYLLKDGATKRNGGLAAFTVKQILGSVHGTFVWLESKGYTTQIPTKNVFVPPDSPKEVEIFTPNEVTKLINAARPKWMGNVISLAFRTGMRRGEIYGLKWTDINFDDKFLTVRRSVSAVAPRDRLLHNPKTRRSIRRISLDTATLSLLLRLKTKAKSEWVIENQYGEPISPWYNTKYMADACDRAKIPRRNFHCLRHTHATVLMAANIHPKVVQERLGHSNLMTTMNTYSHVLPTMQQTAVDALEKIK